MASAFDRSSVEDAHGGGDPEAVDQPGRTGRDRGDPAAGWYPLAKAGELRAGRWIRRMLFDRPVALTQGPSGPLAFEDRCPHRGAALSDGHWVDGRARCAYHGWSFDSGGHLTSIPGWDGDLPGLRLRRLPTREAVGLVFVGQGEPADEPWTPPSLHRMGYWRPIPGAAQAALIDIAENILDTTHTRFVHPWLLRRGGLDTAMQVRVRADRDHVEARYFGEGRAGGALPALLGEGERALAVGRFVRPGIAEVEFHGAEGPQLLFCAYLVPAEAGRIAGYGLLGLAGPRAWAWLKWMGLRPWLGWIHAQDRRVLERTERNRAAFREEGLRSGPLDFMRPQIEALLQGREPPAAKAPLERLFRL